MITAELRKFIRKNRAYQKTRAGRCATRNFVDWLNEKEEIYNLSFLTDNEYIIRTLQEYANDAGASRRYFYSEAEYAQGINLLCKLFGIDKRKVNKVKPFGRVPPDQKTSPVPLRPTVCNLCGGKVILMDNANIYGKSYGSGKCYFCTNCHAFVGTHKPWPDIALGVLSDSRMRAGRRYCHALFDSLWNGSKKNRSRKRQAAYDWLTEQMGIPRNMGHFGYFDLQQLRQAYRILKTVEGKKPLYSKSEGKALKIVCFMDAEV